MRRGVITTFAAVAVLAGCLFPSFDGLKNTNAKPGDDDDATEDSGGSSSTTSSSSGVTSASSSTTTSSSSGNTSIDSGVDSAKPPVFAKAIKCDSQTCTPGTQVCCGPVIGGDSDCLATSQTLGHPCGNILLFCDGAEECAAGEVCCFSNGESHCKATCADTTLCDPTAAPCPAGKTCKGGFGVPGVKTCLQ